MGSASSTDVPKSCAIIGYDNIAFARGTRECPGEVSALEGADGDKQSEQQNQALDCEVFHSEWYDEFENFEFNHPSEDRGVREHSDGCHRPKLQPPIITNALVCCLVPRSEILANDKAKAAIQQEWDRLRAKGAWGDEYPREWADVAHEARISGEDAHYDIIFGFAMEKNTDLPVGDSRRKFKGRVVFQ